MGHALRHPIALLSFIRNQAPSRDSTMARRLSWEGDGRDWPNRDASRFVAAGGLQWHVQIMGQGPPLLLLHGTGAATHSWRALMPLLARHFLVVAPDLPGHGFTGRPAPRRLSLPGMAQSVGALLQALEMNPRIVVGHSAGAALLARLCLDRRIAPEVLVSLNGALLPLAGLPGVVFSPLAKMLAQFDLVPRLFARHASDQPLVAKLLQETGSILDAPGIALYRRLASNPEHVGAALDMMANWDLRRFRADLPRLETQLVLVAGGNDRTIPPADTQRVRALLPAARIVVLSGLGHLAHEEQPRLVAALLMRITRASRGKQTAPHAASRPRLTRQADRAAGQCLKRSR